MGKILATIKAPTAAVEDMKQKLNACGIHDMSVRTIDYEQFVCESRMNYDCVFPQMWEEQLPVAYIDFSFDAPDEGRAAAFNAEYHIMQIPLNLRYDFVRRRRSGKNKLVFLAGQEVARWNKKRKGEMKK